ncbi:hypothetical protein LXA43DRAFT_1104334 [Ganoderma leucocontextum]|nr:hypothetical protein LXA43DRAFT_1104334 [Ganoderma leucocontextum]
MEDLCRQEGLDDEDDGDFTEAPANRHSRKSKAPQAPASTSSQSRVGGSMFSAVLHTTPSNRASLERIRGQIPALGEGPVGGATPPSMPATEAGSENSASSPQVQTSTTPSANFAANPLMQLQPNKRTSTEAFPDDADQEVARVLRRALKKDAANASRLRYKHYRSNRSLYRAMRLTGHLLQVRFATQNPFPSPEDREDTIQAEFSNALQSMELSSTFYTLTGEDIKLLQTEDCNIRSRVIKIVNARLSDAYRLIKAPRSPAEIEQNKAAVQVLLTKSMFHFEKPDQAIGRFQHPFIWEVISEAFFSNGNALGCLFQAHFKPIPHELIALVLTCIRHGLQKWETGRKLPRRFSGNHYTIFDQYFAALEQFDESLMQQSWRTYRREQFKIALLHAGCSEEEDRAEAVIDLAQDDELQRELELMKTKLGDAARPSSPFDFSGEIEICEPELELSGAASNWDRHEDDDDDVVAASEGGRPSRNLQTTSSQLQPEPSEGEPRHTPLDGLSPQGPREDSGSE